MTKQEPFSNPAFRSSTVPTTKGFHLIPQINNFNSVFDPKPLDQKESTGIEKLLVDNFQPGIIKESQVETDSTQLKNITAEIKAIMKQGAVLAGERIKHARDLLKPYKDGTFSQWIDLTFGSRKTAYNMLAYYELYTNLPNYESKQNFKKLPQKIAYLLATKDASIEDKVEIIDNYYESSVDELTMLIQDKFPSDENDGRRKAANKSLLDSIEVGLKKILKRKNHLSEDNLEQVLQLKDLIESILAPKESITESYSEIGHG